VKGWRHTRTASPTARPAFPRAAGIPAAVLFVAVLAAGFAAPPAAWGEAELSADLTILSTISSISGGEWFSAGAGIAKISALSAGDANVKAGVTIQGTFSETAVLDITRAWVKFRFPGVRFLIGKTGLSWGEGSYFNAGDILFGSTDIALNLTDEVIRDNAAWLASVYVPLGRFSFLEAVYLPPTLDLATSALVASLAGALSGMIDASVPAASTIRQPSLEDSAGALRAVLKAGGVKMEAGGIYRGDGGIAVVYGGIQGHILADLTLTASVGIAEGNKIPDAWHESLSVSFGAFSMMKPMPDLTLTFRLEGLLKPWGSWNDEDGALESDSCGLLLYPEISIAAGSAHTMFVRLVVSPVDESALVVGGYGFSPLKGLSLLAYATVQAGEETDLFGWDRPGGIGFAAGVRYIF